MYGYWILHGQGMGKVWIMFMNNVMVEVCMKVGWIMNEWKINKGWIMNEWKINEEWMKDK